MPERGGAGVELIRQAAPREEIRAVIKLWVGAHLFRRHVGRCADGHADTGECGAVGRVGGARERLGDAEIGDHCGTVGKETLSGLMSRCTKPCACA